VLPEAQREERLFTACRQLERRAIGQGDFLALWIDRITGFNDDARTALIIRWRDIYAEPRDDPEAMQVAVVAPQFSTEVVLFRLKR